MRILVVDDQADILLMLQNMLAKTGHEITLAQDSRNALTMMEHLDFDIFIVDLVMPVPTGPDLIRRVRQKKPSIRIVAMTGGDQNVNVVGPDGANTILYKPFSRAKLFEALAL